MWKIAKIGGISTAFLVVGLVIVSKTIDWCRVAPEPDLDDTSETVSVEPHREGDRTAAAISWARKIAGIGGISAAFLIVAVLTVSKAIKWICIAPEPKLDGTPEILSLRPHAEGDRTVLGRSWLAKRHGIRQMYLEGDPFAIGWTNATLTSDLIREVEESLLRAVRVYVRSYVAVWLLGHYILIRNRRLPLHVPDEFKMEALGLSRGYKNYYPEISPLYHRLLNYHAGHDIGHAVEDTSLGDANAGDDSLRSISRPAMEECTSFAALGGHVPDGHLIVGRNCDTEMGCCLDVNKIVSLLRPQKGHAFISVSWAGWLGVCTGMNDQRLFVSINAGKTVDNRTIGTPVCFVARQVLQYASSLEEAVEIVEKAQVFVSDSFLIADGKEGKALVVEKSPRRIGIRLPERDYVVCSNHFLSEPFEDDPARRESIESSASVARFERMRELVARAAGELDVPRAASILRDRRGKNDLDVGNGNRSTINYLVATHSVIADVTTGTLWVSASPHQLGAYVPFTIGDFGSAPNEAIIPEDPFLTEGGYSDYLRSEDLLARGGALLRSGQTAEARRLLHESSKLNPEYFRAYVLLGEISLKEGNVGEARRLLRRALKKQPSFRRDREKIHGMLRRAESASSNRSEMRGGL